MTGKHCFKYSLKTYRKLSFRYVTQGNCFFYRDKPDGKEIRYACWEILDSLTTFRRLSGWRFIVELSSCDEFYIDLTEEINRRMAKSLSPSMVVGNRTFLELEGGQHSGENLKALVRYRYDNMLPQFFEELQHEKRLFLGALLMQEINTFVFAETRLVASVGVGGNKLMAKMAVSLNKPNGITAFPNSALGRLGDIISIDKIPGYGSVFGTQIKETLNIESMNELARTEFDELEDYFGDRGIEIYLKSKGLLDESVKEKLMNDEISCGKSYYGQVNCYEALKKYFTLLVEEMLDRLDEELFRHVRYPLFLRFGIQYIPKYYEASSSSKVDNLNNLDENSRSWCGYTAYISAQTWEGYMEHAMETFCDEDPFDIKTVKIVKLEVRAKCFQFY